MGVYIKGMDKPECCATCHFNHETYLLSRHICIANRGKEIHVNCDTGFPDDCPMDEVKEPHGDLIDRNALLRGEGRYIITFGKEGIDVEEIERAPTVIEAEG